MAAVKVALATLAAAALAAGCASRPPERAAEPPRAAEAPPAPAPEPVVPAEPALPAGVLRLHCDGDRAVVVHLHGDAAQVQGLPQGEETLLLDAGGVTPRQRVYSNEDVRMEIGLGDAGREAVFQLLQPVASDLRCAVG